MDAVYNCITYQHDLRLVGLAAVTSALASFTAISLLHHVQRSGAHMKRVWLAVSAISTGFGIWAAHFIAMLAFSPGEPTGYDIAVTALSLFAAILLTGAGLAVAVKSALGAGAWLGGAMVGWRHRGDALHRNGGVANPGADCLGSGLGPRIYCVWCPLWRRRAAGRIARRQDAMENPWRLIVERGDLQSSLHRDECCQDHLRSGDGPPWLRVAVRLPRNGRGTHELDYRCSRLWRRRDRDARSPA